jgi:hypothetical protein
MEIDQWLKSFNTADVAAAESSRGGTGTCSRGPRLGLTACSQDTGHVTRALSSTSTVRRLACGGHALRVCAAVLC